MPSARKHLRNAERHLNAADAASRDDVTRSWAAVALFYSAHQLVHSVLDGENTLARELRHPESHGGATGTSLTVSRKYRGIAAAYKSLFGTSHAVRYFGQIVTPEDYDSLRDGDYERVRQWARDELLGQQPERRLPDFLS